MARGPEACLRALATSSLDMASEVARRLSQADTRVLSVDSVVICEQPQIAPLREQMRSAIAQAFGLPVATVNVKGKTAEGMGPIGRGEGIEARAVALGERGYAGS